MKVVIVVTTGRGDLMEADFLPRFAARTTLLKRLRAARTIREVEPPSVAAIVGMLGVMISSDSRTSLRTRHIPC